MQVLAGFGQDCLYQSSLTKPGIPACLTINEKIILDRIGT
jgi:hypothetical protein